MIEDRDDLIEELGEWLDRDDLADRAPTFIQFVEARLNRLLEDPEMDAVFETTAAGDYTDLPADFGQMISISTGEGPLAAMGAVEFAGIDHSISGIPRFYSIVNRQIAFAPADGTAAIRLVYRRRIPALTEMNTTNWLLELAPDVYFYGTLCQAFGWDVDDERVAGWKAIYDEAIAELGIDANRRKYGAGPISPRIRRA